MSHLQDFYSLLSVQTNASLAQLKSAYHRLLLQSHPDKHRSRQHIASPVDIALIKEAYTTLSNPDLRAAYDARLDADLKQGKPTSGHTVPRPAQFISLEEFQEDPSADEHRQGPWRYPCRCGGSYTISTVLMEEGKHLIPCTNCSELIWVGYEVEEE